MVTVLIFLMGFGGGGFVVYYAVRRKVSLLQNTMCQGHFESILMAALARNLFDRVPDEIFEVRVHDEVWQVFFEDDTVMYRKKNIR